MIRVYHRWRKAVHARPWRALAFGVVGLAAWVAIVSLIVPAHPKSTGEFVLAIVLLVPALWAGVLDPMYVFWFDPERNRRRMVRSRGWFIRRPVLFEVGLFGGMLVATFAIAAVTFVNVSDGGRLAMLGAAVAGFLFAIAWVLRLRAQGRLFADAVPDHRRSARRMAVWGPLAAGIGLAISTAGGLPLGLAMAAGAGGFAVLLPVAIRGGQLFARNHPGRSGARIQHPSR